MMIPSEPPTSASNGHFGDVPAVFQQAEHMLRTQLLSQLPANQMLGQLSSSQLINQLSANQMPASQLAQLNPQQMRILQNLQQLSKKVKTHIICG